MHSTQSGTEFNTLNSNKQFYKVLNKDFIHNNLQLHDGLNVDPIPFSTTHECSAGGIYFTDFDNVCQWISYSENLYWIVCITVPDDAIIYEDTDKYKANKIILHFDTIQTIGDFLKLNALEMRAVQNNECALKYITEPTHEICLAAVQHNGDALHYVKEQSTEICLVAVQHNGHALQYVKEQTHEICLAAMEQNIYAFYYVKHKTFRLYMKYYFNW